jgi:hypothetical protein
MEEKSSFGLWLLGIVIGAILSAALATLWFNFSLSGRISLQGEGKVSGGAGSQSQVGSPSSVSQTSSATQPNQVPPASGGHSPENDNQNITALWISERSGMPYFVDDTDGRISIFEDGPDHHKVQVGHGRRTGRHFTLQFYSNLDDVDGVLELELSEDAKTLNGLFRGLDPTKEARVKLLRSVTN